MGIYSGNVIVTVSCLDDDMRIEFAFIEQFMYKFAYCHNIKIPIPTRAAALTLCSLVYCHHRIDRVHGFKTELGFAIFCDLWQLDLDQWAGGDIAGFIAAHEVFEIGHDDAAAFADKGQAGISAANTDRITAIRAGLASLMIRTIVGILGVGQFPVAGNIIDNLCTISHGLCTARFLYSVRG